MLKALCVIKKKKKGGSGPERRADPFEFKFLVDASALSRVGVRSGQMSSAEGMLMAARREALGEAGPSAVVGEGNSKEGKLTTNVDVDGLPPEAEVAGLVGDYGGLEQLVPRPREA